LTVLLMACPGAAMAQTYTISTFAGGALPVNLPGTSASLYGPQSALASDASGNVYFGDGNTVLRLDGLSGVLTIVAGNGTSGYSGDGGPAVGAQLRNLSGIAVDAAGGIYIASVSDHVVRKVSGGVISTVAGTGVAGFSGDNGLATGAQLNSPYGVAVDAAGNLFIADYGNSRIREVTGGVITTVAGNGTLGFGGDNGLAIAAQLSGPRAVLVDAAGNLYIADSGNYRVRIVTAGVIGTVAGNGVPGFGGDAGPATSAQLNLPCGLALDAAGNLLIADYYNNRIRQVSNGVISTMAGKGTPGFSGDNGPAVTAQLNNPFALALDGAGNLFIADYGNNRLRKVSGGIVTTVAGNGTVGFSGDGGSAASAQLDAPHGLALDSAGNLYIVETTGNRSRIVVAGVINTAATGQLTQPWGVAVDSADNVYFADTGGNRVRKLSGGTVTTVVGTGTAGFSGDGGPAVSAQLNSPASVAVDAAGDLYIADSANNRVRKVTGTTITTVAGSGVPASDQLTSPTGVALDSAGNLYIADTGNNRVRKLAGGVISTIAGNGVAGYSGDNAAATGATLNSPGTVAVAANGALFVADTLNSAIRRVVGGTITTITTIPGIGLGGPQGLAVDAAGNVYVADTLNNRVRLLTVVPLSITGPSSLANGTVGAAYGNMTFTATGGSGGYTWSATGLPKGLTISTAGVLSGIPTVAGVGTPQFTVKDSSLAVANSTLSVTIDLPVPTITTLSPASATVYGAAFTLTVNGTGFLAGAVIQWNGASLVTKLVNATQLTAPVTAALISSAGSVNVTVSSGGASNMISNTVVLPVNPPTPALTGIAPASATATAPGFTVTAAGTGFVATSQLFWNGAALQTSFVSATQLTAAVPANLIASAGTAGVTANSGGASSSAVTFTINPPPCDFHCEPRFRDSVRRGVHTHRHRKRLRCGVRHPVGQFAFDH